MCQGDVLLSSAKRGTRFLVVCECLLLLFGQIPLVSLSSLVPALSLSSAQATTSQESSISSSSSIKPVQGAWVGSGASYESSPSIESTETSSTPTHEHDFQYVRVVLSTDSEDGYILRKCPIDSLVETITIPALGHDYETTYRVDRAPTYDAPGQKSLHCKRDGAIKPGSALAIPQLQRPQSVDLQAQSARLFVGEARAISLNCIPAQATPDVSWRSSDTHVISIDASGKMVAKRAGSVRITGSARLADGTTQTISFIQKVYPHAPAQLSGYSTAKKVYLYWPASLGAQQYNVYRATNQNGPYKKVSVVRSNHATISSKMSTGKTYYFLIQSSAYGAATNSKTLALKISGGSVKAASLGFAIAQGSTRSLTPRGVASKGGIHYRSSNPAIASVSSKGIMTARSVGSTTIIANYRGYRYVTIVNVRPRPVLSLTSNSIVPGSTTSIKLKGASSLSWKSSNTSLARVSKAGTIRGVKAGKVVVSTRYLGRTYSATVYIKNVVVKLASSVTTQERHAVRIPYTIVAPHGAVTWSSSNTSVVRVTKFGEAQGLKVGSAVITAKAYGKTSHCTVVVKPYDVLAELNKIDLSNVHKVMIVAHPDDESLWGGAVLLQDKYLVVNVTCGVVASRVDEFRAAMRYSGDIPLMLSYPDYKDNDLVRREVDNWSPATMSSISSDIKKILAYKNWDEVVTHSPEGESGHRHHRWTDEIVTTQYTDLGLPADKLRYFGHLYSDEQMKVLESGKYVKPMGASLYAKKIKLLSCYPSQMGIINGHKSTNGYEYTYLSQLFIPKY